MEITQKLINIFSNYLSPPINHERFVIVYVNSTTRAEEKNCIYAIVFIYITKEKTQVYKSYVNFISINPTDYWHTS